MNAIPACPPEGTWDELAIGLIVGPEADRLLEHASYCPGCAIHLKAAIEVFGPERNADDARERKVIEMKPRRFIRSAKWLGAAAAAVAVTVGLWMIQNRGKADPLDQLAQAYTAHRTLDLRIPGAAHSALRVERSANGIAMSDRPPEMLDAAARIARDSASHKSDPAWLHAKGRLALLEGKAAEAIDSLVAARDLGGSGDDVTVDLATAYYVRGRTNNNSADYTLAAELLSEVLHRHPNHSSALFNRALVEEELFLLLPAIEDLEKAIAAEPSSEWKKEMADRLAKLKARTQVFFERKEGAGKARFAEVAFDEALRSGLWRNMDSAALGSVSARMKDEHTDSWLEDALALPRTKQVEQAIAVLAGMTAMRLTSSIGGYAELADSFERLSTAGLPKPLRVWRELEDVYRGTHAPEIYHCKGAAQEPTSPRYPWFAIQILRESAVCDLAANRRPRAQAQIDEAVKLAKRHEFPIAATRLTGVFAAMESIDGRYREALNLAHRELTEHFSRSLPIQRSHEYFNTIMLACARMKRFHAARRASWMATRVAESARFENLYYTNLSFWAESARRCEERDEAKQVYAEALRALDAGGEKTTTPGWRAWAELVMAEAENDPARLARFEKDLEESTDVRQWVPYQRVKASFEWQAGKRREARERLEGAMERLVANPDNRILWRDQFQLMSERLLNAMLVDGEPEGALTALEHWRTPPGKQAAKLDAATVVFVLAPVEQRIAVWRKQAGRLEFHWASIDLAEAHRMSRRIRGLLASPAGSADEVRIVAGRIAESIFGKWLQEIRADQSVVFETDSQLGAIPFAMLPGRSRELGLETQVASSLGPVFALDLPPKPSQVLIVDATRVPMDADLGLSPLPAPDLELKGLNALSAANRMLSGSDAHPGAVRRELATADLLHFAGHTVARPSGLALLLAPEEDGNRYLDFSQSGSRVPARVVLSACSTGKNAQEEIDSLLPANLANTFLQRGAKEVIAARWNADSEAASFFMQLFYRHLANDGNSGRAMRDAQREMAQQPRFQHPYYWGVFARFI